MMMMESIKIIPRLAPVILTLSLIYLSQIYLVTAIDDNQREETHHETNSPRNDAASSRPTSQAQMRPQSGSDGLCAQRTICAPSDSSSPLAANQSDVTSACYCDRICRLYDDCCQDSPWAEPISQRVTIGPTRLRERRRDWICRQAEPAASFYVKASCHPEWVQAQKSSSMAELAKLKCELGGARLDSLDKSDADWLQTDPLSTLMPITDLLTGITYANSYCYRCNSFNTTATGEMPFKLILWSPLVTCNYNLDSNDRDALFDLMGTKGGRALAFSRRHNKWSIKMALKTAYSPSNVTSAVNQTKRIAMAAEESNELNMEPVCSFSPQMPEQVKSMIRYCKDSTIVDSCPITSRATRMNDNDTTLSLTEAPGSELERALKHECELGHQALVYGRARGLAYYNEACSRCNLERQVSCEPPTIDKRLNQKAFSHDGLDVDHNRTDGLGNESNIGYVQPNTTTTTTTTTTAPPPSAEQTPSSPAKQPVGNNTYTTEETSAGIDQDSHTSQTLVSGSFSVLLDLYDSPPYSDKTSGSGPVGSKLRCKRDVQVFDPFFQACRCVICGVTYRLINGTCIHVSKLLWLKPMNLTNFPDLATEKRGQTSFTQSLPTTKVNGSSTSIASATENNRSSPSGQPATSERLASKDREETQKRQQVDGAQEKIGSEGHLSSHDKQASPVGIMPPPVGEHTSMHDPTAEEGLALSPQSKPVYITGCFILVSTMSFVLYFLLYRLATLDWRYFVVRITEKGRMKDSLRRNSLDPAFNKAKAVAVTSHNSMDSQTSSSRRVACLAVALVGACLIFVIGYQNQSAAIKERDGPTNCAQFPQSQSELDHRHNGSSSGDSGGANPFVALFNDLIIAHSTVPLVVSAWKMFAECGKVLVQPEHYRLFDLSELNFSLASPVSVAEWLANRPNPYTWNPSSQRDTWALVSPYNITLAPGQFEPVEQASGRQQLGLLVCSSFKSNHMDKFKPIMVHLTTCCLTVSITSLVLYLLLYWLSTCDLRHLKVVGQTGSGQLKESMRHNNPEFKGIRCISESDTGTSVKRQSLSARGLACLAGSLLIAYLLFVLGHHSQSGAQEDLDCCARIAALTYGSFLLAFNWMFLLSYDIWRTLRLATHHLRVPTRGSQTGRFVIYATLAFFVAAFMVLLAALADHMAPPIDCPASLATTTMPGQNATLKTDQPDGPMTNCSQLNSIERIIQTYRPKFGQRAGSCWFSNRNSLALFFGLPVAIIMLLNLLFFLHSSFMVVKTASRSSRRPTPTSSVWSRANEQMVEFARKNSLVTISNSGAQAIESSILALPGNTHSVASISRKESNSEMLMSAACIQNQIDQVVKRMSIDRQQPAIDMHSQPQQQKQQTEPAGSVSREAFADTKLMAAAIVNKCDNHLSNLGAVMSSLAKDYRLYCRLSTIMGLTWLTGLAASLVDQSELLWYLFVVLNSLQGLFIFVAFGLKRSRLRNLWILIGYINQKLRPHQKPLKDDVVGSMLSSRVTLQPAA